jgi:hypothetical protein
MLLEGGVIKRFVALNHEDNQVAKFEGDLLEVSP